MNRLNSNVCRLGPLLLLMFGSLLVLLNRSQEKFIENTRRATDVELKNHRLREKRNELPPGVSAADFQRLLSNQPSKVSSELKTHQKSLCQNLTSIITVPEKRHYLNLYNRILYHQHHRLLYCPVWKAMSTTWDSIFLQLNNGNNLDSKNNRHEDAKKGNGNHRILKSKKKDFEHQSIKRESRLEFTLPEDKKDAEVMINKARCSLLIVRHPLLRLLSAYRDKMLYRKDKVKDYIFIRSLIIHRYRRSNSTNTSPYPTFAEFVEYVLDEWSSSDPRPGTWRLFMRDWHPAYYLCAPCDIDYTHIIHYENYAEDISQLSSECGLENEKLSGEWQHRVGNAASEQLEEEFFRQLTVSQVLRLGQMYYIDLSFFGYEISPYLNYAEPDR